MQDQSIGVQKVVVKQGDEKFRIRVEMFENDNRTRLFINDQSTGQVYPSPTAAYADATRRLNLSGTNVELRIDVACNVMDVADVAQDFQNNGVNVEKILET